MPGEVVPLNEVVSHIELVRSSSYSLSHGLFPDIGSENFGLEDRENDISQVIFVESPRPSVTSSLLLCSCT